jgi:hypothetical protein
LQSQILGIKLLNYRIESNKDLDQRRNEFTTKISQHTPKDRLDTARDLEKLREKKSTVAPIESTPVSIFGKDGKVLQVNQGKFPLNKSGKWDYKIKENSKTLQVIVEISKFLSTSLIDVDIHPTWIQFTIKQKLLRLVLDHEVSTDNMHCERSMLTGELVVTLQKVGEAVDLSKCLDKIGFEEKMTILSVPTKSVRNATNSVLDYRKGGMIGKVNGIIDKKKVEELKEDADFDFVDDPDVPPLC